MIQKLTILLAIGVLLTIGTYFKQTTQSEFAVDQAGCIYINEPDSPSPCSPEPISERGYPLSFIEEDDSLHASVLPLGFVVDTLFWSFIALINIISFQRLAKQSGRAVQITTAIIAALLYIFIVAYL